jgi:glycosyltransferase involved in cell wall biosynthesis
MKTITLAIDAVGAKHGGGATVLKALIASALSSREIGTVVVFCSPRGVRAFDFPEDGRLTVVDIQEAESGWGRIRWWRKGLGAAATGLGAHVMLCLSGGGLSANGVPSVTFIQQSLPFASEVLRRSSLIQRFRLAVMRREMKASCCQASAIIVQTPTMKLWMERAFDLPLERISVAEPVPHLAIADECGHEALAPMRASPAGRRLLFVGTEALHKNLPALARANSLLRDRLPDVTLFATIHKDHKLARRDGIVALGRLPSSAVREAYELATVVIMPSLVETVGLPILEAFDLGVCVAASDRPYAHDVCEGAASFFDPLDPEHMAECLYTLLMDESQRRSLAAIGRRVIDKRRAARPYDRMIEITVEAARRSPKPPSSPRVATPWHRMR